MTVIDFTKMHGIGNDYVFVDATVMPVAGPEHLARALADRYTGIGGDGLILIELPAPGVDAHLRMRMFNADGSEAEMCGNGIRCVGKLAYERGLCRERPLMVQTGGGVRRLDFTPDAAGRVDRVTVDMGVAVLERARIPVEVPGRTATGRIVDEPAAALLPAMPEAWIERGGVDARMTCVSVGNPHAVFFCRAVDAVPLAEIGPVIETASCFPERVNVHFVEIIDTHEVVMRTWERGSGATRACGSGASAVCVAGAITGRTGAEVLAHLPGGDLRLRWSEDSGHVEMTGPAVEVFRGTVELP